ncbi:MAG: YfhO family protein [Vicinamibacterales bacterium]
MSENRRGDLLARLLLTAAALAPYWRLLTFSVVFVTDDYFASDIFNGELPGRILSGHWLRAGQLPQWTSQLCSGFSLAGAPLDPIGLALFALLPPAAALDALVIVLLMVAAHGAYSLARRFGADRIGAVLAGTAFAGSGYIACQLKHLSIVSTVVWLPVGLLLIDRSLAAAAAGSGPPSATDRARRSASMAAFGLVFAVQVLSGFPQSAYICALTYGAFALFRAFTSRQEAGTRRIVAVLGGLGLASVLGAAAGAVLLLPLSALGAISDRAEGLSYSWSTRLAYWPSNLQTFLVPYINGDISDNTYIGPPFFWEDYGYVGALTCLLAIYAAYRERRRPLAVFTSVMTIVACLLVLGQATPVFHIAYLLVPGLKIFRFPTRFLIFVELGLALLAALGLTRLRADLTRRWPAPSRLPAVVVAAVCAVTAVDLFVHQPRQNPIVPAADWLAPPPSVEIVRAATTQPRTFTPRHRDAHRRAFQLARGWADVLPYFELRDMLAPNLGGGLWNVPSGDCYVGLSPRWFVDVWGDHNRELSLMSFLAGYDFNAGVLRVRPNLPSVLRAYGVTHMLSIFPAQGADLPAPSRAGSAYIYRIDGAARVRVVPGARHVTDAEAARRLLDPAFDPEREVLLHDAPSSEGPMADNVVSSTPARAKASIVREDQHEVVVEAEAEADGFLLLADTFYPGWSAAVDGHAAALYRANLSVRAVPLPKGRHVIRFSYEAPGLRRGLLMSVTALTLLLVWLAAGCRGAFARSPRRG